MKMKAMKRFSSIVLALVMMLAMVMNVSAGGDLGGTGDKGKITINKAIKDSTYNVYRIFEPTAEGEDSYKVVEGWEGFLELDTTKAYVGVREEDGVIIWQGGNTAENVAAFAKLALEYAKESDTITPEATQTATGETVEFTGLPLGYYLVDSSAGAVLALDNVNTEATIEEKNGEPTLDKEVEENGKHGESNSEWGEKNDVNIGDTVNFRVTITAQPGALNYVMHDKMDPGLTFQDVTSVTFNGTELAEKDYEVKREGLTDDCTFEVVFSKDVCDRLQANDKIVVSYSAVLNENAVVGNTGNKNESHLSYGENNEITTVPSETHTYTYEFDLVKTGSDNTILDAEFELYDAQTGGNKIELVDLGSGEYRVATEKDKVEGFTSATIKAGKVTIKGLEMGIYWLEETKAPTSGSYIPLKERQKVEIKPISEEIADRYTQATLQATLAENGQYQSGGVRVINLTSDSQLPSTGGIGTTIFYVVGGILVVGAVVLLVVKKRMSHQS